MESNEAIFVESNEAIFIESVTGNIMYHDKVHAHWDEFCSTVERIKNTEICSSTGVSPVQLIFGQNANSDRGHLYPVYETRNPPQRLSSYIQQPSDFQRIALEVAIATQAIMDRKHLSSGRMQGKFEFNIDDYVLFNYTSIGHLRNSNLSYVDLSELSVNWPEMRVISTLCSI